MQMGSTIAGRFLLGARVGAGGMGVVYRAIDTRTGGTVALKLLRDHGPDAAARFEREASVLGELSDPAIVRYVAHGLLEEDIGYLAMEWLEGETLAARLARGTMSVQETLRIGFQVASGVARAHERGIVHRDLKPANIFLRGGSSADVVVLDFGIARLVHQGKTMTATGTTLGTPGYMPPEQARGSRVDARSDVYAIACVMFRTLAGRTPHVGDSAVTLLVNLVSEPAPRLASVAPAAPRELDALIAAALAQDPGERPADAGELASRIAAIDPATDLRRAISVPSLVAGAAPMGLPTPLAAPPPTLRDPTPSMGGRWRLRTIAIVGAAVAGVAAIAVVSWLIVPNFRARKVATPATSATSGPSADCPFDGCIDLVVPNPERADPFSILAKAQQLAQELEPTVRVATINFATHDGVVNLRDRETMFNAEFVRPDEPSTVHVFVNSVHPGRLFATVLHNGSGPPPMAGPWCPPDRVVSAAVARGMAPQDRYDFTYSRVAPFEADPAGTEIVMVRAGREMILLRAADCGPYPAPQPVPPGPKATAARPTGGGDLDHRF